MMTLMTRSARTKSSFMRNLVTIRNYKKMWQTSTRIISNHLSNTYLVLRYYEGFELLTIYSNPEVITLLQNRVLSCKSLTIPGCSCFIFILNLGTKMPTMYVKATL